MTDNAAIRELLARYALSLDVDDIDGCLELFTADAEFVTFGRAFTGRDGIGAMMRNAPSGLHLTGVSTIDVRGDTATARSQALFVEAGSLRLRPALYDDDLVKTNGQWRFRRRRCQFITSGGLSDRPEAPPS
jgi:uncharacterized protein (TIGR02246 family)